MLKSEGESPAHQSGSSDDALPLSPISPAPAAHRRQALLCSKPSRRIRRNGIAACPPRRHEPQGRHSELKRSQKRCSWRRSARRCRRKKPSRDDRPASSPAGATCRAATGAAPDRPCQGEAATPRGALLPSLRSSALGARGGVSRSGPGVAPALRTPLWEKVDRRPAPRRMRGAGRNEASE